MQPDKRGGVRDHSGDEDGGEVFDYLRAAVLADL